MPPEEQAVGGEVVEQAPVGMDMEAALGDIAESLSLQEDQPALDETVETVEGGEEPAKAEVVEKPEPEKVDSTDVAPDTWRKEAKEAWAAVPPAAKEEMRKREADIQQYVERVKQPAAIGEKLNQIIAPYLPMFEKTNVDPWQNIQAMLQAQEMLLFGSPEQKLSMFQALAQQAGIKVENGQISAPPDLAQQHIRQLMERLQRLEGGVSQVTTTVQEARQLELQQKVAEFAQDAAHPHFYECTDRITHLIQTRAAGNLQEAYDMAVMADPVIRQQVVESEAKQLATARAKADRERVAKARKPGVALVRSTHAGKAAQPTESIDDTLTEALAAIKAR